MQAVSSGTWAAHTVDPSGVGFADKIGDLQSVWVACTVDVPRTLSDDHDQVLSQRLFGVGVESEVDAVE